MIFAQRKASNGGVLPYASSCAKKKKEKALSKTGTRSADATRASQSILLSSSSPSTSPASSTPSSSLSSSSSSPPSSSPPTQGPAPNQYSKQRGASGAMTHLLSYGRPTTNLLLFHRQHPLPLARVHRREPRRLKGVSSGDE